MAKRTRLNRPYPTHALEEVVELAETIQNANGGRPVVPELLAGAVGRTPRSSVFIQHLSSSAKYGLTTGSPRDDQVELTSLGEELTTAKTSEERRRCLRRAALKPDVFRAFYEAYGGKWMPEDVYGANTLTKDLGVHRDLADECMQLLRRNGLFSGVLFERDGSLMVELDLQDGIRSVPTAVSDVDSSGSDSAQGGSRHILVVSGRGHEDSEQVVGMMAGLSVPIVQVTLDTKGSSLLPEGLAEGLLDAQGCVYLWPGDVGHAGTPATDILDRRAWAVLGAVISALDSRVIVIGSLRADAGTWDELGIDAVDGPDSPEFYPRLLGALIESGVVNISLG